MGRTSKINHEIENRLCISTEQLLVLYPEYATKWEDNTDKIFRYELRRKMLRRFHRAIIRHIERFYPYYYKV